MMQRGGMQRGGGRDERRRPAREQRPEEKEFDQAMIEIARVTRVMAGGKRMRFRACIVLGDHKGRIGMGLAKGADVTAAVSKATTQARKHMQRVPIRRQTIPHHVLAKEGAAKVMLRPAPAGTGIIAGGVVRTVLELAGVPNVVGKILGSKNKINTVRATLSALSQLKSLPDDSSKGKTKESAEAGQPTPVEQK